MVLQYITGRGEQATELIADGIHDGMWNKGWAPKGIKTDLHTYLLEKLKAHAKRLRTARIAKQRKRLMDGIDTE